MTLRPASGHPLLRLALALTLIWAGTLSFASGGAAVAVPPPRAAASTEEDTYPGVVGLGLDIGRGYSAVSFNQLWEGERASELWVDPSQPIHLRAYFGAVPRFRPDGTPYSTVETVNYTWAEVCPPSGYGAQTPSGTFELAPAPGTTIFNYHYLPAAVVIEELPFPTCETASPSLSIRFRAEHSDGGTGSLGTPTIRKLPAPFGYPGRRLLDGDSPKIVLWKLNSREETQEIRDTGSLPPISPGSFRYLYASCPAVQEVYGWLSSAGSSKAGLSMSVFEVPRRALERNIDSIAGFVARQQGWGRVKGLTVAAGAKAAVLDTPTIQRTLTGIPRC